MAINLLGSLPTLANSPKGPVAGSITTLPAGVRATSPTTNVSAPKTTLPSSQVMSDEQRAALRNLGARQTAQNTPLSGLTINSGSIPLGTTFGKQNQVNNTDPLISKSTDSPLGKDSLLGNSNDNTTFTNLNNVQGDSLGKTQGQTPEQMRAALGNPTSGAGSLLPSSTVNPQAPPAPAAAPTQSGLLNMLVGQVQNGSPDVQQALAYQRQLDNNYQQQVADTNSSGIPLQFAQGREQILRSQYADLANKAATGVSNALSSQGQQFGALQSAAGLTAPAMQFGQLTNQQTGQVISPAGGNPQLNAAVQQALALINNNSSIADAIAASGLSNFGYNGTAALTAALQQSSGGTYNPTQQNAGALQNASQATHTQEQAFQMDTALKQLDTIKPLVTNFLQQSGLNSQDNPDFNASLRTYYGKFLSPGNKQIFETYMGDIQKYTSQVLAAGGGSIPTDVSNALSAFDPRDLTVSQLQPYLDSLAKLGGNQLSVLQSQQSATGGTGYSGTPTSTTQTPTVAPTITPSSITSSNPIIQGMIGGTLNAFGGALGATQSFFSHVFGG